MKALMACRHETEKKGTCKFGDKCGYSHDEQVISLFKKRMNIREQIKKYDEAKAKKEKKALGRPWRGCLYCCITFWFGCERSLPSSTAEPLLEHGKGPHQTVSDAECIAAATKHTFHYDFDVAAFYV